MTHKIGSIKQILRFPVKSMEGENLRTAYSLRHNQVENHTYYPGTLFKGVLGVYGVVEKSGEIALGDNVSLVITS